MATRSSSPLRELTPRAVLIGLTLSVVMGAANVYVGLKVGMTVSASIPAAVLGMLSLRALPGRASILEANQIQTAASAGESLAAGILFTLPALLLIGVWDDFDWLTTSAVAFAGGLLGVLFMVPMRRVFVAEEMGLPYPEGVACAAVLRAGQAQQEDTRETHATDPGAKGSEATSVVAGSAVGAVFKLLVSYAGVLSGSLEAATLAGGQVLYFGAEISPMLVAVGFIIRLNVALLIALGGALGWLVCIPAFDAINGSLAALSPALAAHIDLDTQASAIERAHTLWSQGVRYIGVGAMLVGGIASIVKVRGGLLRAVTELRAQMATRRPADPDRTQQDLPASLMIGLSLITILVIAAVYYAFTGGLAITLLSTGVMVVMSFFFVAVAAYIVGLVGNSNSPVSGMTITAVLLTGALLWIFGFSGTEGMVATLGVAAIVCCAACTSGDVCNDLKTGALVGATPRNQQLMQVGGVAVAALIMAPVLSLLHEAYRIGSPELSAPQAGLFASLARGFFGDGELPWGLVGVGALIGLALLGIDRGLEARERRSRGPGRGGGRGAAAFRVHLMPVAVGIYLPFGLSVPMVIGGLLASLQARRARGEAQEARALQRGVLFSSGIIAGEALIGVVLALVISSGFEPLTPQVPMQGWLTIGAALVALGLFVRQTRGDSR